MRDRRSPAARIRLRPGAIRRITDSKRSRVRIWSAVIFATDLQPTELLAAGGVHPRGQAQHQAAWGVLAAERPGPVERARDDHALAAFQALDAGLGHGLRAGP